MRPLLSEFSDVFPDALPPGLPPSRPTDHSIDLLDPNARPPPHRCYRIPEADKAELRRQLDDYLSHGYIEPARSPYGAGVLFATKKGGDKRLCVDYRGLNSQTAKDVYPIPRIDEAIDTMAGSYVFSKIDLRPGFHQIRIVPAHRPLTAFQTCFGSFQWRVMPFGLCNAPSTFQRTMQMILDDLRQFVVVYIDDIVIFSRSEADHLLHLREVLIRLRRERLYGKLSKCSFFAHEIEFCGFIIGANGVRTQPDKIQAISKWPTPTNLRDVRAFIGLCGFYQKFIPRFAAIIAPLTDLMKKDHPFTWSNAESDAFNQLKSHMKNTVELAFPDFTKPFYLHMDASDHAVGATLSQYDSSDNLRLLACMSRKMDQAQRNYPTHERELLAFVLAVKQWRHYLLGHKTNILTDNHT